MYTEHIRQYHHHIMQRSKLDISLFTIMQETKNMDIQKIKIKGDYKLADIVHDFRISVSSKPISKLTFIV